MLCYVLPMMFYWIIRYAAQVCPSQSGSEWDTVAHHGTSCALYEVKGKSYGIRNPTRAVDPAASAGSSREALGLSFLKHGTMATDCD